MREVDIFRQTGEWLSQSLTVWLCTVLDTWGSSPRPRGSLLVCNSDGNYIGSLSGGCVEDDLIARIAAGEFVAPVTRLRYGATAEEAERLRLPCGGILTIAIEKIEPTIAAKKTVAVIVDALQQRQGIIWQRHYPQGYFSVSAVGVDAPLLDLQEHASGEILSISHSLGPQCRLLLIGVSDVSRAVAQLALLLDYDVVVCDPRDDARSRWNIPGVKLLVQLPDDVVRHYANDPHCAILALTHDPRIDDMGLMEAFNTCAFYIGAMGSLRTSEKRRERLLQLDVTAQQLQRLHAPVGINNGSKTPMEIAVSILAELTAVRARVAG